MQPSRRIKKTRKALLIVDLQNDFCPGGALGVPEGDKIVPKINRYIRFFAKHKLPIFASRDWHPVRTKHFKSFGGIWPEHCIQNTNGSAFYPKAVIPKEAILIYKGMDPEKDCYSVFQAEDISGVNFAHLLKMRGITELYIGGLATDYCVRYSALDALRMGFKVRVLLDAVKGVDLRAGDSERAIKEIVKKGAKKITIKELEGKK